LDEDLHLALGCPSVFDPMLQATLEAMAIYQAVAVRERK
jgi:hypothetical protein